jgi:hypothetical protein
MNDLGRRSVLAFWRVPRIRKVREIGRSVRVVSGVALSGQLRASVAGRSTLLLRYRGTLRVHPLAALGVASTPPSFNDREDVPLGWQAIVEGAGLASVV